MPKPRRMFCVVLACSPSERPIAVVFRDEQIRLGPIAEEGNSVSSGLPHQGRRADEVSRDVNVSRAVDRYTQTVN